MMLQIFFVTSMENDFNEDFAIRLGNEEKELYSLKEKFFEKIKIFKTLLQERKNILEKFLKNNEKEFTQKEQVELSKMSQFSDDLESIIIEIRNLKGPDKVDENEISDTLYEKFRINWHDKTDHFWAGTLPKKEQFQRIGDKIKEIQKEMILIFENSNLSSKMPFIRRLEKEEKQIFQARWLLTERIKTSILKLKKGMSTKDVENNEINILIRRLIYIKNEIHNLKHLDTLEEGENIEYKMFKIKEWRNFTIYPHWVDFPSIKQFREIDRRVKKLERIVNIILRMPDENLEDEKWKYRASVDPHFYYLGKI